MVQRRLLSWTLSLLAGFAPALASAAPQAEGTGLAPVPLSPHEAQADLPQLFFSNPDALLAAREAARSGEADSPALRRLHADAEAALAVGPFTVTDKPQLAPSGDPHDYLSLGRYWWPDPTKPDGLPYVELDGQVNPETRTLSDKVELQALLPAVSTLAHASYVFGDARYAEHAALLLRTWFLEPATRMNPNLEYSQLHKGHVELGGSGIIDSRDFALLPDAVALLQGSAAWSAADDAALRQWFTHYLDWMLDTEGGRAEAALPNNHRTWYWYQALPLLLYTGQAQRADDALRNILVPSLDTQLEPDGSQPLELSRTKGFSYSIFNLMAWSRVAQLAETRGVDLWHHQGPGGRGSLHNGFAYLLPYLRGERPVTDVPVVPERPYDLARLLHGAAQEYGEPGWSELARSVLGARADALELDRILAPATH